MTPARRLVAEGLGTALLLAIGIGSGIMGERLAGGNVAIALLAAGIRPNDAPGFIAAQLLGAAAVTGLFCWLYPMGPHRK